MTVNVKALINNLGQTYEALFEAGYIPYKTKPKGDSGCTEINLDMAKEGVLLSFDRATRKLVEVDIDLIREENSKYVFPNELPEPLQQHMYRPQVHEEFGQPKNSHPPYQIIKRRYGGVDHYPMKVGEQRVSMLLYYNLEQVVTGVAFKPTELVEWKELDPSLLIT
ncbi:TPA: DUF6392 family protein [Aeromonas veronii AMC24]|jgi:hypothetical protein|uniref:DUF6392 family protein n=2 Tax=Aeromonas TaxID=642 RepID=UPI0021DB4642|nr:DUF6392 family protein [Aeromonas veronii]UYB71383.1 DUF6392 family protein [Aeromonas veronii]HDN9001480.1 hypothetical protein [Aeromonas veronii AMC24]